MKVTLGKEYRDSISGFQGVATARTTYLHGCVRVLITPTKLKSDGDFLPDCWFDEPQLTGIRSTKTIEKKKKTKVMGGPSRSVEPSKDTI